MQRSTSPENEDAEDVWPAQSPQSLSTYHVLRKNRKRNIVNKRCNVHLVRPHYLSLSGSQQSLNLKASSLTLRPQVWVLFFSFH